MTEVNPLLNNTSAGQIAQKLDAADGTKDGKINASIWNKFAQEHGGKTIKESIDVETAMNSITTYVVRGAKSAGKAVNDLAQEWLNKDYAPASGSGSAPVEGAGDAGGASAGKKSGEAGAAGGTEPPKDNPTKEAKAKEMGLRPTYNDNFYYSETEKEHYKWDSKKQTFIKYPNIAYMAKDGTYRRAYKNPDGSIRSINYSADGYPAKMDARNSENEIYLNRDSAAKKLGLKETRGTRAAGIYYDEQTKMHYQWNPKTHAFDALKGVEYVGIDGQTYKGKYNSSITTDKYGIKTETVTMADGSTHKAVDASGVSFNYNWLPNDNKVRKTFKEANNFLIEVANMNPKPEIRSWHNEDYDWKEAELPDGRCIKVRYDKEGEITDILISYDTTPEKTTSGLFDGSEVQYTKDNALYDTDKNNSDWEGSITSGYDFEKLKALAEKIFG